VTDTPRTTPPLNPARGVPFPEHAQTPAAIRGWLAPAGAISRHIGSVWRFNGAHHMLSADVYRFWAFGTYRHDACYYSWRDVTATCAQAVIWHVAGLGFDTRTVPNGRYLYCVQAITDASVKAMRCLGITIAN
jgi:hypothetical protein